MPVKHFPHTPLGGPMTEQREQTAEADQAAGGADQGSRWLSVIERLGNRLPHPFMLFVYLALLVAITSTILSLIGVEFTDPESGDVLSVRGIFTYAGVQYMLSNTISNFVEFPPLGLVLGVMLGIGVAQQSGLLKTAIRKTILNTPAAAVTYVVILVGIIGNLASDAAFVIIPPLAALVFYSLGRHPIAGLAAGFAGVGAGFTANIIIAGTDALLSGITTQAAQAQQPGFEVTPADNYYFMVVSALILPVVGTWVTERIVAPQLGTYDAGDAETDEIEQVGDTEARGLRNAAIVAVAYVIALAVSALVPGSPLRGENGAFVPSPLLDGLVPLLLLFFLAIAVAYGVTVGSITETADVPKQMRKAMGQLTPFIVLIFAAAQFIGYFEWTRMASWLAVTGASALEAINLTGILAILAFIAFTALLNLLVVSGSAQWALEAPIFVPLFMVLGYDPAYIQAAFRIADSSTNIITPMNPYILVVLGFMQDYDEEAGLGTLISTMVPYSLAFLGTFLVIFLIFTFLGIPFGPGVSVMLQ